MAELEIKFKGDIYNNGIINEEKCTELVAQYGKDILRLATEETKAFDISTVPEDKRRAFREFSRLMFLAASPKHLTNIMDLGMASLVLSVIIFEDDFFLDNFKCNIIYATGCIGIKRELQKIANETMLDIAKKFGITE